MTCEDNTYQTEIFGMLQIFFLERFPFLIRPHVHVLPFVVDEHGVLDQAVGVGELPPPLIWGQQQRGNVCIRMHLLIFHLEEKTVKLGF